MNKRQTEILKYLKKQKFFRTSDLAKKFNYSESTIRRDLAVLENLHLIKRVSGGAIVIDDDFIENPTELKYFVNSFEKNKIADLALDYIADYHSIFLDSSSTCQYLGHLLQEKKHLTIFTTNLSTADLIDKGNISHSLYMIGGQVSNGKVSGSITEKFMRDIEVDIAFISCKGVSSDYTISEVLETEALFKKIVRQHAKKVILVADHSKINRSYLFKSLSLSDIDCFITDKQLPQDFVTYLEENNIDYLF
ncbi:DeoR/GlpR family DNA-binding transcription regulator [Streptococcus massiliensis]|uniref:Transcriptional regulator n=1 Tax=Streptococcus massiliensis TaxID=313439 RepID=A0A380KWA1_9STRE|nr:DeoR/GlpR family DNA-binding transcription regulator [Streptococcus massiliensis]SUN75965.1 transcriptional regulator [Streptococcus massiliensis]